MAHAVASVADVCSALNTKTTSQARTAAPSSRMTAGTNLTAGENSPSVAVVVGNQQKQTKTNGGDMVQPTRRQ